MDRRRPLRSRAQTTLPFNPALLGLLRRLSQERPLLVALDDVQWLDPPSAGALHFAMRRLGEEPVRVLASVRQRAPFLDFENPERIAVGPLPLQALAQLLYERLGARFLRPMLRQLEERTGVPGGFIESDLVDPRYFSAANIKNRIESYLQMLDQKRAAGAQA